MKRTLSLITATALISTIYADNIEANLRFGYVDQSNDNQTNNTNAAIGGSLFYEKHILDNFKAGVGFYTTHRLMDKDDDGVGSGLFDGDDNSYSILGQAYIDYSIDKTNVKIGRQQIDTPFADSDDIRMVPNLFNAYILSNTNIENTTLILAKVNQWSGVDKENAPEKFDRLSGDGVIMASAIYDGIKDTTMSAWYYNVDKLTSIVYIELSTAFNGVNVDSQFANFAETDNSTINGNVWGIALGYENDNFNIGLATNFVSADNTDTITNGFGGGPYLTSMEETTLDGLTGDSFAYMVNGGAKIIDRLSLNVAYGSFEDGSKNTEIDEFDVAVEYEVNEQLNVVGLYTNVSTTINQVDDKETSFDRVQFYANYNF